MVACLDGGGEIDGTMGFVTGFVFLVCLTLLVMIFGEKFSVFAVLRGDWVRRLPDLLFDGFDVLSDGISQVRGFVLRHLWWVLAVGSGAVGVFLTGWMMFGAVVEQAAAELAVVSRPLHAGGVLDTGLVIDSQAADRPFVSRAKRETVFHRIVQEGPSGRFIDIPRLPVVTDPLPDRSREDPGNGLPWERDRPPLRNRDWDGERFLSDSDALPDRPSGRNPFDAGPRLQADLDVVTIAIGRPVDSLAMEDLIDRALGSLSLSGTRWQRRESIPIPDRDEWDTDPDESLAVPNAASWEIREMEDRVRILPGRDVSQADLRIDKRGHRDARPGQFTVEIDITNTSDEPVSGLVVREYLDPEVIPVFVSDGGVFRDGVVTWVIPDLDAHAVQSLRVRLHPSVDDARAAGELVWDSRTEVSAVTAVRTSTRVRSQRGTRLPIAGTPDVRMTLRPPDRTVKVRENLEIPIELHNRGTGPSGRMTVRVRLPHELDHITLEPSDRNRTLVMNIRPIAAGESRTVVLRTRATDAGIHEADVELLDRGRILDRDLLMVRARAVDSESHGGVRSRPLPAGSDLP